MSTPCYLDPTHCYRYWGVIDDALRAAAYRGVTVRLLASYWEHTDDDMIRFMKSLSDDSMMGYKGLLEMVTSTLSVCLCIFYSISGSSAYVQNVYQNRH